MESLRRAAKEIAYAGDLPALPPLLRALVHPLSLASSLYGVAVSLRLNLYRLGLLPMSRLPVPVISVGNLTWGGNGKTPMVEFIAELLVESGIPPLILTRGYAGGDEARMLQRHFSSRSVQIGIGANRAAIAMNFLRKQGYRDPRNDLYPEEFILEMGNRDRTPPKLGAAVLDDGMQHLKLVRDVNIVMVNGLHPWGNGRLIPLGPLREPLTALERAEIAVIHNADMVPKKELKRVEATLREANKSIHTFFTRMMPMNFHKVGDMNSEIPLEAVRGRVVLCLSAIGSPDAFIQSVEKLGALHVDRLDFSDHHSFQMTDIRMVQGRLQELDQKLGVKPVVILTEKDYDRDPEILGHLHCYGVWALRAKLEIIRVEGSDEATFKKCLLEKLTGRGGGGGVEKEWLVFEAHSPRVCPIL
ncbi:hypothetical protein MLD38_015751 [Melastoma candidum]|uniref:Uncharacterized protein n=1 Tax=Melastoma candidum TaxID=119954 RepID=A0ACB9RQM1_9MYRT|nr:hypothetical protein MLD38_015751 [Melastoma candidum]